MSVAGGSFDDVLTVTRPWGRFEQFTTNAPSTVKVITVDPHHRLSLQRHRDRDELWQVIDGVMDVEVDGRRRTIGMGERVWVPRGTTHRMGNSGATVARILEIGFGTFREDDIERIEDDYERVVAG